MQTTCYQLAGTSIRCNAICPGVVRNGHDGAHVQRGKSAGTEKKIGQLNPLRRARLPMRSRGSRCFGQ
jgi:NAD(P)-dependent dehydrogenase (short-subunit alcohol dehydrogenase family)